MSLPKCPACFGTDATRLWSASAEQAAQAFVRAESDPPAFKALAAHIAQLWGAPQTEVMRCGNCGLGYAHPFVAGDAKFYNIAYPGTPGYPDNKWEFLLSAADLPQRLKKPVAEVRCLEVGAGIGNFLKRLPALGLQSQNILALEYNEESLRVLRERGFSGRAADVRTLETPPVDFIFAFQVVEHMGDLDGVFARFASLLAPQGVVYIAMPNPARIDFNEANGSLLDMPPNHISRWTRPAVEHLVARHGLALREFRTEPGHLLSFLRQDLKYYTLRQSMTAGTLASAAYESQQSAKRKLMLAAVAALYLVRRLPLWLSVLGRYKTLGGSVWARLERADPVPTASTAG